MYESLKSKLRGINAINVTPFDDQLQIDWQALADNITYLLAHEIKAVYPCGNTGEFYSLTLDEAKAVTRSVTQTVAGRCAVIAGVGYDTQTAIELAQAAQASGADGIMVHQPVHPFMLPAGLIDYYQSIAAATTLPLILYVRNEAVTVEVLQTVCALPNVIAVKYAINHMPSFTQCVQEVNEDIVWLCGTAEMWAPYFYASGAEGFTSGMVNVDTTRSFAMLAALQRGDYMAAMSIWAELEPFESLRAAKGNGNNVSVVKEAMYQLGLLPSATVRPPLAQLQHIEKQQVAQMLTDWGLQPRN